MRNRLGLAVLSALVVASGRAHAADATSLAGTWRRDDGQLYRLEADPATGELRGRALEPPVNETTRLRYAIELRLRLAGEKLAGTATWSEPNPKGGTFTAEARWELALAGPDGLTGRIEWLEWAEGVVKARGFEEHTFRRIHLVQLQLEGMTTSEQIAELERALQAQQKEIDALSGRAKPAEAAGGPAFEWGFKDGFFVKGEVAGASYELRPRARLQLDYRAFVHSTANRATPHPIPEDEFLVRRARVGFGGAFGPFEFTFDADPIRSPLPIADFWFQWHPIDELQLRFGSFKAPFDEDDFVTSDLYLDCVERPMFSGSGNQLAPDYRIGAMVFGKVGGGVFNYWLAVCNQPDANTVPDGDPLFTGRVEVDVKGFELGVGALFARVGPAGSSGPQKSFTGVTPGQFVWFTAVNVRGWEQAYVADTALYLGPAWLDAACGWGQQERNRIAPDGTSGTPLVTQGAQVTLGYMFWGPTTKGPHGVPFADWSFLSTDIAKKRNGRNVGAELVCRVEWMDIRDARGGRRFTNATLTTPSTPSTAANATEVKGNQAAAITAGLNIYPIENVKIMLDYVHVRLGDASRAERAHSRGADEILVRTQLEF